VRGPFNRPDDVGTKSTAIVRTFAVASETTTANPELIQTQVASLLVQPPVVDVSR
jgi:hypothetical protein